MARPGLSIIHTKKEKHTWEERVGKKSSLTKKKKLLVIMDQFPPLSQHEKLDFFPPEMVGVSKSHLVKATRK